MTSHSYLLLVFFSALIKIITLKADVNESIYYTIKPHAENLNFGENLTLDVLLDYPSNFDFDIRDAINQLLFSANPFQPSFKLLEYQLVHLENQNNRTQQQFIIHLQPLQIGDIFFTFLTLHFASKNPSLPSKKELTPVFHAHISPPSKDVEIPSFKIIPLNPEFILGLTDENKAFLYQQSIKENQKLGYKLQRDEKNQFFLFLTLCLIGLLTFMYFTRNLWRSLFKPSERNQIKQKIDQLITELKGIRLDEANGSVEYQRLSRLLRLALNILLKTPTSALTTYEIESLLKSTQLLSNEQKSGFILCLHNADESKFNGILPSQEKIHRDDQFISDLIIQLQSIQISI